MDSLQIVLVPAKEDVRRWKAVPLLLRKGSRGIELLAFEHPLAGRQLVKGGLKKGESLCAAALRELQEESGIRGDVYREIGWWESGYRGQLWGFCRVETPKGLPDRWKYYTKDGGGLWFHFFWQRLEGDLKGDWHPVYRRAIKRVKNLWREGLLDSKADAGPSFIDP